MKVRVGRKTIRIELDEAPCREDLAPSVRHGRAEGFVYGKAFALRRAETPYGVYLVPEDRPGEETHHAAVSPEEAEARGGYLQALLDELDGWVAWANEAVWVVSDGEDTYSVAVSEAPTLEALAEVLAELFGLEKGPLLEALKRREEEEELSYPLWIWEEWLRQKERYFLEELPSPKRLEEPHALIEFDDERDLRYLVREADWEALERAEAGATYEIEACALEAYRPYALEDPYLLEKALREGEGSVLGDVGRIALDRVKLSVYHGGRGAVLVDWSEDGEYLFLRFPEREGGLPEEAEGWERGLERGKAKESYARLYGLWRAGFRGFLPSTDLASGEAPEEVFGAVLDEDGAQVLARLVLGEGGLGLEEVPLERLAKAAKEVALEELAEV